MIDPGGKGQRGNHPPLKNPLPFVVPRLECVFRRIIGCFGIIDYSQASVYYRTINK